LFVTAGDHIEVVDDALYAFRRAPELCPVRSGRSLARTFYFTSCR
jgi:hypothetical protein